MTGDDNDVRVGGEVGPVDHPHPGVGHMAEHGLRPDHVSLGSRGPPLGQDVLDRATDGHDLGHRGADAERPQLAHVVLAGSLGVVGDEGDLLIRGPERGYGRWRVAGALIADPDASVEVEQDLIVAAQKRGEGHQVQCP